MKRLLAIIYILLITNVCRSQSQIPLATMEYLLINPDPVGSATGFGGVTRVDGNSYHYNVANAAFFKGSSELDFNFVKTNSLAPDMELMTASYLFQKNEDIKRTAITSSLQYMKYGSVELRDHSGKLTDVISPYDANLKVSMAKKLSEKISMGVGLKYLLSNRDVKTTNSINADIGVFYTNNEAFKAACSINNIGGKIKSFYQPTLFRIGGAYTKRFSNQESNLECTLELNQLLVPKNSDVSGLGAIFNSTDQPWWTSLGLSYTHHESLSLRAGIFIDTNGGREVGTIGIGFNKIKINNGFFNLNLSYKANIGDYTTIGNTFQFGIQYIHFQQE